MEEYLTDSLKALYNIGNSKVSNLESVSKELSEKYNLNQNKGQSYNELLNVLNNQFYINNEVGIKKSSLGATEFNFINGSNLKLDYEKLFNPSEGAIPGLDALSLKSKGKILDGLSTTSEISPSGTSHGVETIFFKTKDNTFNIGLDTSAKMDFKNLDFDLAFKPKAKIGNFTVGLNFSKLLDLKNGPSIKPVFDYAPENPNIFQASLLKSLAMVRLAKEALFLIGSGLDYGEDFEKTQEENEKYNLEEVNEEDINLDLEKFNMETEEEQQREAYEEELEARQQQREAYEEELEARQQKREAYEEELKEREEEKKAYEESLESEEEYMSTDEISR
ncbi:hypothetical protein [Peptoniphilus catoniae]|uniref:hypothetical protein n=1 Tax=Peptoniphilus catoniae TaxID=1660341 RepID=UPI0010FF4CC7|nr:hypothetical protein [Peptoniphilus catoniae]